MALGFWEAGEGRWELRSGRVSRRWKPEKGVSMETQPRLLIGWAGVRTLSPPNSFE